MLMQKLFSGLSSMSPSYDTKYFAKQDTSLFVSLHSLPSMEIYYTVLLFECFSEFCYMYFCMSYSMIKYFWFFKTRLEIRRTRLGNCQTSHTYLNVWGKTLTKKMIFQSKIFNWKMWHLKTQNLGILKSSVSQKRVIFRRPVNVGTKLNNLYIAISSSVFSFMSKKQLKGNFIICM